MGTIIKVIILIFLIAFIAWAGVCVYSNFIADDNEQIETPDIENAAYEVYIKNTGNVLYTDKYDQHGQEKGNRTFVLQGYWEINSREYKYHDGILQLKEIIFGEIEIKRR